MALIDFILNLVGLLLWLNWRAGRLDPIARAKTTALSVAGALRRAEPRPRQAWLSVVLLGGLLVLRAVIYWVIGSGVDWVPKLNAGIAVLSFRSGMFPQILVYSFLSFGQTLLLFYFWLLALMVINRQVVAPNTIQKLLRLHLGQLGRWPRLAQIVLPVLLVVALWAGLHPLLVQLDVAHRVRFWGLLLEQGLLVALAMCLTLKYLFVALLCVHVLANYVYLGKGSLWDFIGLTGRNLLTPLRGLPLQIGKVDLAPIAGMVFLLLLLHVLPNLLLSQMEQRHLTIWPQ